MRKIIYDNRPDEGGYGLYDADENFPIGYTDLIMDISSRFEPGEGVAIRYTPLGMDYLLSIVLRDPAKWDPHCHARKHVKIVHWLMDGTEADHFFELSLRFTLISQVKATIENVYNEDTFRFRILNEDILCQYEPLLPQLMTGAFYGASKQAKKVFIGTDITLANEPEVEDYLVPIANGADALDVLMYHLPESLRKDVGFTIGALSGRESIGTTINLGTTENVTAIKDHGFAGSDPADIFTYFDNPEHNGQTDPAAIEVAQKVMDCYRKAEGHLLLTHVIKDWDTLRSLKDAENPYEQFDEGPLMNAQTKAVFSSGEKDALLAVLPHKYRLLRRAIGDADIIEDPYIQFDDDTSAFGNTDLLSDWLPDSCEDLPKEDTDPFCNHPKKKIPVWLWPAICGGVCLALFLCWLLLPKNVIFRFTLTLHSDVIEILLLIAAALAALGGGLLTFLKFRKK